MSVVRVYQFIEEWIHLLVTKNRLMQLLLLLCCKRVMAEFMH